MFRGRMRRFPFVLFSLMFVKLESGRGSGSEWGDVYRGGGGLLPHTENVESFDFIIVGGGTAGCLLANRLSENGRHSVLVLEAGIVPPEYMNIPAFANEVSEDADVTFQYYTTPQDYPALRRGEAGMTHTIPLGRVLGGTSQINHMAFNRGSPMDWNNWAFITGDPNWAYENMLPFFRRVETYMGRFPNPENHGFEGPIFVNRDPFAPGYDEFIQAGRELGFPNIDPNAQRIGFGPIESSKYRGRRWSSYEGFLRPIMKYRSNLKVVLRSFVTRVLFEGNTAVGVEFNLNRTETNTTEMHMVRANKEVILSAGVYNSPPILQRSGIGPRDVLNRAGIPVLKVLPVGMNLQTHPRLMLQFALNNRSLSYNRQQSETPEAFERYLLYGQGPFTSIAGYAGQAYFASSVAWRDDRNPQWPDIQFVLNSVENPASDAFQNITLSRGETTILLLVYLAREKSRGTVMLNPRDINGVPIIDYNTLSDPRDLQIMFEGINRGIEVFERTHTYQAQGGRLLRIPRECDQYVFRSEDYFKCYISRVLGPGDHPAGTCGMNLVVDSNAKVYGMRRLRVVDASIMPFITNANIQGAIYGIAERISNQILNDHEY